MYQMFPHIMNPHLSRRDVVAIWAPYYGQKWRDLGTGLTFAPSFIIP